MLARSEYVVLEKLLRAQGFENDLRPGAPICRWVVDAVTVDVMPTLEDVLGFSNRWYPLAVDTAEEVELPSGLRIRVVTAPAFIATKLEAFAGRGGGDYLFSHDLGDVISIIDGRASLLAECREAPSDLRHYLADHAAAVGKARLYRRASGSSARRYGQSGTSA